MKLGLIISEEWITFELSWDILKRGQCAYSKKNKTNWHEIQAWRKLCSHSHANWTSKGADIKSFVFEFGMVYEVHIAMPNKKSKMSSKRAFLHGRGVISHGLMFLMKFSHGEGQVHMPMPTWLERCIMQLFGSYLAQFLSIHIPVRNRKFLCEFWLQIKL